MYADVVRERVRCATFARAWCRTYAPDYPLMAQQVYQAMLGQPPGETTAAPVGGKRSWWEGVLLALLARVWRCGKHPRVFLLWPSCLVCQVEAAEENCALGHETERRRSARRAQAWLQSHPPDADALYRHLRDAP